MFVYIKGIFAEWLSEEKKARKFYDLSSRNGYQSVSNRLAFALYRGELRFMRVYLTM